MLISVPLDAMHPVGDFECSENLRWPEDSIATFNCCKKCWSKGSLLTYTYKFKGEKFQVFGTIDKSHKRFSIYLDDVFHARCDERYGEKSQVLFTPFYTSGLLTYGEHTVMIQSEEIFELVKMTYWVSIKAKRINSTQFSIPENWSIESDSIGDLQLKAKEKSVAIQKPIYASKFWIIGSGNDLGISVKYQNEPQTAQIKTDEKITVIYESTEFPCKYEDLLITANNQGVIINCIYIFDDNCHPKPTEMFSKSDLFSVSKQFTQSFDFSKSSFFSSSELFDMTNQYSKSDFFSYSDKFSKSYFFSKSEKFTRSDLFFETYKFTGSFFFSESAKFSYSDVFSDIKVSSEESSEISSSEESSAPLPSAITCGVFDGNEYYQIDVCKHTVNVIVLLDNFTDYRQNEDGSAINLANCGHQCNDTNFVDCVSSEGAGCAIYFKNSLEIANNATFTNTKFFRCKALYCGAIFIFIPSNVFNISIEKCHFESNEAFLKSRPTGENKNASFDLYDVSIYVCHQHVIFEPSSVVLMEMRRMFIWIKVTIQFCLLDATLSSMKIQKALFFT